MKVETMPMKPDWISRIVMSIYYNIAIVSFYYSNVISFKLTLIKKKINRK